MALKTWQRDPYSAMAEDIQQRQQANTALPKVPFGIEKIGPFVEATNPLIAAAAGQVRALARKAGGKGFAEQAGEAVRSGIDTAAGAWEGAKSAYRDFEKGLGVPQAGPAPVVPAPPSPPPAPPVQKFGPTDLSVIPGFSADVKVAPLPTGPAEQVGPTEVSRIKQNLPVQKPQAAAVPAQKPAGAAAAPFAPVETPAQMRLIQALRAGRDAAMTQDMTSPGARNYTFNRFLDEAGARVGSRKRAAMSPTELLKLRNAWGEAQDRAWLKALPEAARNREMERRQAQALMEGEMYKQSPEYLQQRLVNEGKVGEAAAGAGAAAKQRGDEAARADATKREIAQGEQATAEKQMETQKDIAAGRQLTPQERFEQRVHELYNNDKLPIEDKRQGANDLQRIFGLPLTDFGASGAPQKASASGTVTVKDPTGQTRQMPPQEARAYVAAHPGFVVT